MKGGALRNQSTGGRRLGIAAVICGILFGAPLFLLQSASAHASRSSAAASSAHDNEKKNVVHPSAHADGVNLQSTTTTTTAPPPPHVATNSDGGEATWYSAAPAGYCASPTLPFGTVLTVVNNATGASTECTVDDREAAGYPRVVDMSPSGFSQIGDLGQGVVDVTISW